MKKEATGQISPAQQKRIVLSSISRKLRKIKEAKIQQAESERDAMYWESRTINDLLMQFLYNRNGDRQFKTFNQWKQEGKLINKGAKAAIVWGQPIKATGKPEAKTTEQDKQAQPDEFKMYPLCYLFSNEQTSERRPQ